MLNYYSLSVAKQECKSKEHATKERSLMTGGPNEKSTFLGFILSDVSFIFCVIFVRCSIRKRRFPSPSSLKRNQINDGFDFALI